MGLIQTHLTTYMLQSLCSACTSSPHILLSMFCTPNGMSWAASRVLGPTTCLAHKVNRMWETKYFYSPIYSIIISPQLSIQMNSWAAVSKDQKSPTAFILWALGWEILTWCDKWREFHGKQRNVFVIFVREDERSTHWEWTPVIENMPQQKAGILAQRITLWWFERKDPQ